MEETILLYNLEGTKTGEAITTILNQLGVKVRNVAKEEIHQSIGYLLELDGFEEAKVRTVEEQLEDEMLVIHHFTSEQIDLMLDIFKEAKIPFIPLKAMVTQNNVSWTFQQLYQEIKREYLEISNGKQPTS